MTTLTSNFFLLLFHHQDTYVFKKKKYVLLFASPIIQQPFVSSVYAILGFIITFRFQDKRVHTSKINYEEDVPPDASGVRGRKEEDVW